MSTQNVKITLLWLALVACLVPSITSAAFGDGNYEVSPHVGTVVINEVLFRSATNTTLGNEEFIEIWNTGSAAIDLDGWYLIDADLVGGVNDGSNGTITNTTLPIYCSRFWFNNFGT
jgi:hypothetical protein